MSSNSVYFNHLRVILFFSILASTSAAGLPDPHAMPAGDEAHRVVNEAPATNNPVLESQGANITVRIGDPIQLPCVVRDLEPYVLIWRKGLSTLIYAGTLKVSRDERISLKEQNSLLIEKVDSSDEGVYVCSVSTTPPLEIEYHLKVSATAPSRGKGTTPSWRPSSSSSLLAMEKSVLIIVSFVTLGQNLRSCFFS